MYELQEKAINAARTVGIKKKPILMYTIRPLIHA